MKFIQSHPRRFGRLMLGTAVVTLLATGAASAAAYQYRYFRFTPKRTRGGAGGLIQIAEFQFFNGATLLTATSATDPTGNFPATENPPKAIDGITADGGNKWLNFDYPASSLILDFGATVTADSYNYYTGGDATDRDPTSWTIEGSADGLDWVIVDNLTGFVPPTARNTIAKAGNFVFPTAPKPIIANFEYEQLDQGMIIKNATPLGFYINTSLAPTSTITSSAGGTPQTVSANGGTIATVNPPPNALTTYTLTATTAGGTTTATLPVRTVAGATLNYRYIRYTPVKVRDGKNIQLANFEFSNGGVPVPVTAVESTGGTEAEPVANLIDDPTVGTTWTSTLAPVIFDFGTGTHTYDGYAFTVGGDTNAAPLRWLFEGSNDKATWTTVDNVYFDYNTPTTGGGTTTVIPFSGTSLVPYAAVKSNLTTLVAGESATLSYDARGASSATLSGVGSVTGIGTAVVSPTATTTYTLSTTSTGGYTAQAAVTVIVLPSLPTSINYPDFETAPEIITLGSASITADPLYSPLKRLRVTPKENGQIGAAWYRSPLNFAGGFETTFGAFLADTVYYNGADGMALVIQSSPDGVAAIPEGGLYLPNALTIALDSYPDQAEENEKAGTLQVFTGENRLAVIDLTSTGAAVARGYQGNFMTLLGTTDLPYMVHAKYTPGANAAAPGSLTISVDGKELITNMQVDLAGNGIVDAQGRAYAGFTARTGGLNQNHDVVNWTLTTTATGTPVNPPKITSSSFNVTAGTGNLVFSSTSGKVYKVTQSTDLVTWTQVGTNITATTASTTAPVTFTAGSKGFFRIEEVN